jgi:hypothetical protein
VSREVWYASSLEWSQARGEAGLLELERLCSAGWACPFGIDASDVLQGRPDDHMEMEMLSRNLLIGLFTIGDTLFNQ